mmetsp:Transcript_86800/g.243187  ORF Transcript_86800/g.243187 Transcript_86800/m.243187 type:complete len:211 (+) Transcript_86800:87-719(+)
MVRLSSSFCDPNHKLHQHAQTFRRHANVGNEFDCDYMPLLMPLRRHKPHMHPSAAFSPFSTALPRTSLQWRRKLCGILTAVKKPAVHAQCPQVSIANHPETTARKLAPCAQHLNPSAHESPSCLRQLCARLALRHPSRPLVRAPSQEHAAANSVPRRELQLSSEHLLVLGHHCHRLAAAAQTRPLITPQRPSAKHSTTSVPILPSSPLRR